MSVSSVAVPWLRRLAAVLTAGATVHSWSGPFCVAAFSACARYSFGEYNSCHSFMPYCILLLLYPFWTVLSFLPPFPFMCLSYHTVPRTLCYNNAVSLMQDVTVRACVIAQWNRPHGVHCVRMHSFPKAYVLHECVQTVQIKVCPMLSVVSFCWIYCCWFAKYCGLIWPLLIFL